MALIRRRAIMSNGGENANRGFIFQTIIAIIECIKRSDWDEIKIEPQTKSEKVDIELYKNDETLSSIQVKSSTDQFERWEVQKWLELTKKDAMNATEVRLYLVGDKYSSACFEYIDKQSEIKVFPFDQIQQSCIGELVLYIQRKDRGRDVTVDDIEPIYRNLFAELMMNSIARCRISRKKFEDTFESAISTYLLSDICQDNEEIADNRDYICDVLIKRISRIRSEMDWSVDRYEGYQGYTPDNFTQLDAEVEVRIADKTKKKSGNLLKCLRKYNKGKTVFLLSGKPGSGKSTALIKLCSDMLENFRKKGKIPIYINLKYWRGNWTYENSPEVEDLKAFVKDRLEEELRGFDISVAKYIKNNFVQLYNEGQLYFLFDSFDEIPCLMGSDAENDLIDKISSTIYDFLTIGKQSGGVIASRKIKGPTRNLKSNVTLEIQDFDAEHIKKTFEKNKWNKDGEIVLGSTWIDLLRDNEGLLSLCGNPFYLTLLIDYCKSADINDGLPKNQMVLYTHFLENQMKKQHINSCNKDKIVDVAKNIALIMHKSKDSGLECSCDELLYHMSKTSDTQDYLEYLNEMRICRMDEKKETVTFIHRRFYEFFLAKSMQDEETNIFDYNEITQSNSALRDAMVLYCEVADHARAKEIAQYCWKSLKENIEYRRGLEKPSSLKLLYTLYFMVDAFRNRKDAIEEFASEYEDLIEQNLDDNTHFIIQIAMVNGIALFDQSRKNIPQLVLKVFSMKNQWLNDAVMNNCRQIKEVNHEIEEQFTLYFHKQSPSYFIKKFNNTQFALSKAKGFGYIRRIHFNQYIWIWIMYILTVFNVAELMVYLFSTELNEILRMFFHNGKSEVVFGNSVDQLTALALYLMLCICILKTFKTRDACTVSMFSVLTNFMFLIIYSDKLFSYNRLTMMIRLVMCCLAITFDSHWIIHDLRYGYTKIKKIISIIAKLFILWVGLSAIGMITMGIFLSLIYLLFLLVSQVIGISKISYNLILGIVLSSIVLFTVSWMFIMFICLIYVDVSNKFSDKNNYRNTEINNIMSKEDISRNLNIFHSDYYKILYVNRLLNYRPSPPKIVGEWPDELMEDGYRMKFKNEELEYAISMLEYESVRSNSNQIEANGNND